VPDAAQLFSDFATPFAIRHVRDTIKENKVAGAVALVESVQLMRDQADIAQFVATLLKTHNGEVRSTILDCFVGSGRLLSPFIRAVNEAIATSGTDDTLRLFESTATQAFGSDAHEKGFLDKARVLTYLLLGVRGRDTVPVAGHITAPFNSQLSGALLPAATQPIAPSMSQLLAAFSDRNLFSTEFRTRIIESLKTANLMSFNLGFVEALSLQDFKLGLNALLKKDPIAFLRNCSRPCHTDFTGNRFTMKDLKAGTKRLIQADKYAVVCNALHAANRTEVDFCASIICAALSLLIQVSNRTVPYIYRAIATKIHNPTRVRQADPQWQQHIPVSGGTRKVKRVHVASQHGFHFGTFSNSNMHYASNCPRFRWPQRSTKAFTTVPPRKPRKFHRGR
jgi:hypothetical protein